MLLGRWNRGELTRGGRIYVSGAWGWSRGGSGGGEKKEAISLRFRG